MELVGGSGAWTPASLSSALWLDASDASTITQSSGKVSQWSDKSGNNKHATQTNNTKRPTTRTRTIGNKNIIVFPHTASESLTIPSIDVIGKEVWATFVCDDYSNTTSQLLLGGGGNEQIGVTSSSEKLRLWAGDNPYSSDSQSGTLVLAGSPVVVGWLAHTNTKKFSINGELEATSDSYNTGKTLDVAYVGRGQYAVMESAIGEMIITSGVLSTDDRQRMEGYLAHKWGQAGKLPGLHPYRGTAPGGSSSSAVVDLDGTVSDSDGDTLITTWSDVNETGLVSFGDASAVDTTAIFSEAGTYVLRLTVDDGINTVSDELTIIVNNSSITIYTGWSGGDFAQTFTDTGSDANPDGDGLSNRMEFGMGTDPTIQDSLPLLEDGSRNGVPIVVKNGSGDNFDFMFVRRDDHGASGSVIYTPQFSSDMLTFHDSDAIPSLVTDSTDDAAYHIAKVPYPSALPHGKKAIFGRIKVTIVP